VEQESPRSRSPRVVQCGLYEINLEAGELRKNGLKVRLQEQPFNVLAKLVARPGQLVTREELQEQLWGAHSLVDPELGLNTAIKKLRVAFGDQADNPRFVETIPKRGYRFIAPVRALERSGPGDVPATPAPPLRRALDEPRKPLPPGDRLEAGCSRISPDENVLSPGVSQHEPAPPAVEKAGRVDGAIRRLARFAAAFRGYGGMSRRYGVTALILLLVCAGMVAGKIPYSLGDSAPNEVTFQNLSPATTLSLMQMGSGKVAAKLVDDTGSPIAGASLTAEIVDVAKHWGPTERVLSGHVPNRAAYVVIGVRANTEGATAAARGEADLGAITLTYRDEESQPRIWTSAYAVPYRIALSPDSSLIDNLSGTPVTACGSIAVIPVAPGSPYRFSVPISATGSADRAGYVTMVFVDSQCDEISRASVYFAPASETLRLPATNHDGQRSRTGAPV
jgi:DNA-binding winged helix-turn-helix (wHTH) protein